MRAIAGGGLPGNIVKLGELDATVRYAPIRWSRLEPFVGAGLGYYRLFSSSTFSICPEGYWCTPYEPTETETSTLAHGVNPHLVAGAYVPLTPKWSVHVEGSREFLKRDYPFDLRALRVALGLRYQPPDR
jgi:outer membrane protein W